MVVQEFFDGNAQPRLQIRGSGLQQSPTERGLLVLQAGMPLNRADGAYVVSLTAPGHAEALEVCRGAASTRLFVTATDLSFEIPGPVAADALDKDPAGVHERPVIVGGLPISPGPNVLRDQPFREMTQILAGGRTTIDLGRHLWDFGLSASRTDGRFAFPISAGMLDTDSLDGTLSARYALRGDGPLPLIEAAARWSIGTANRWHFLNLRGEAGAQFGENTLDSSTLALHAGANLPLAPGLTLSPGLGFTHATRDNVDLWTDATRPTVGYNPMMPGMRLPDGAVPTASTGYARSYSG